ncbi:hypothetical protein A2U01_0070356 [Trifolium medium]|uniref:RNase H type-1 domain-containing protein n=1 Tax=Trifolium medium TaxID=97028 RepID=A0A392SJR3_9FABA|nr:hypothetical protein [Trifolium medium]
MDETGKIIAAANWKTIGAPGDIYTAEATALLRTVQLASDLCLTKVVFETDNKGYQRGS